MNIFSGRISDWRRERRIKDLSRRVVDLIDLGCPSAARLTDQMRMDEIRARSPEQVARMERKGGISHA